MTHAVFRSHDDNDGDRSQGLVVAESHDGDLWVYVQGEPASALRYRMPFIGGGLSPNTWEALKVLRDAMARDNTPQESLPLVDTWTQQHPDGLLHAVVQGKTGALAPEALINVVALADEVLALRQRVRWTEHLRLQTSELTPDDLSH